jgi:hypothetical protein
LAKSTRVGKVLVKGYSSKDHGRTNSPGGLVNGLNSRDMGIHINIHLARLRDTTAHVNDKNRRPLAEAQLFAEANLGIIVFLALYFLHARPFFGLTVGLEALNYHFYPA